MAGRNEVQGVPGDGVAILLRLMKRSMVNPLIGWGE